MKWVEFKTHDEKVDKVQDICRDLPTARPGDTFGYQGVTLRKLPKEMESRQHSIVAVEDLDGEQVGELNLEMERVDDVVEMLDGVRQQSV